jgi:hypothetical protein
MVARSGGGSETTARRVRLVSDHEFAAAVESSGTETRKGVIMGCGCIG